VYSFPNTLSSTRAHVVTWPDVECALVKWVQHMEAKGETYSSAMLMEKRAHFKKELNVLETECLLGPGWIGSFKKA
jgi:hypothetical protein